MRRLLVLLLLLTAFSVRAASIGSVVTGDMRTVTSGAFNSPITLDPLSTPISNGTYTVIGPSITVTPRAGTFSNWLETGNYKFTQNGKSFYIAVPGDGSTNNVNALATNGLTLYSYTLGSGFPGLVKATTTDTTPNVLTNKLRAGSGVTLTTANAAGNAYITIAATGGGGGGSGTFNYPSLTNAPVPVDVTLPDWFNRHKGLGLATLSDSVKTCTNFVFYSPIANTNTTDTTLIGYITNSPPHTCLVLSNGVYNFGTQDLVMSRRLMILGQSYSNTVLYCPTNGAGLVLREGVTVANLTIAPKVSSSWYTRPFHGSDAYADGTNRYLINLNILADTDGPRFNTGSNAQQIAILNSYIETKWDGLMFEGTNTQSEIWLHNTWHTNNDTTTNPDFDGAVRGTRINSGKLMAQHCRFDSIANGQLENYALMHATGGGLQSSYIYDCEFNASNSGGDNYELFKGIASAAVTVTGGSYRTNLFSGSIVANWIPGKWAGYFAGDGLAASNLNAGFLASGTIPMGRVSSGTNEYAGPMLTQSNGVARYWSYNANGLTNLNADELRTGTIPDAAYGSDLRLTNAGGSAFIGLSSLSGGYATINWNGNWGFGVGGITASSFAGSGAGLTGLPANQLTGTIDTARIDGTKVMTNGNANTVFVLYTNTAAANSFSVMITPTNIIATNYAAASQGGAIAFNGGLTNAVTRTTGNTYSAAFICTGGSAYLQNNDLQLPGAGTVTMAGRGVLSWPSTSTMTYTGNGGAAGNLVLGGSATATNGYFLPTNAISAWPTTPRWHGEAYFGNSNGVVYLLTSVPGSLTWAATNKIAP